MACTRKTEIKSSLYSSSYESGKSTNESGKIQMNLEKCKHLEKYK